MTRVVEADYLVVGAGASGMAFTDALVDHDPTARVVVVDRRDGPGGHWRSAYPFVRLHQASTFYGVASTVLGGGRRQQDAPEAGLHQRADQPTILAYYEEVLGRLRASGRVELLARHEHVAPRSFASLETAERLEVPETCRVVDARYLSPDIPAETPPRFGVADGARVVPVNDLPGLEGSAGEYVVVGSGKTATDAVVRLLLDGTDPDSICWVRPRDPWMLNRANVVPDPAVYLSMVAGMWGAASTASSLANLFLALEEAGTMLRIDPTVTPTMARAPTLGTWELDLLRSVEHVERGRVASVHRGRLDLTDRSVPVADDAVVVDCSADGLKLEPLVPIWQPGTITVQPVRAGFPCFGAALIGYVEATRDDDREKNRVCAPSPLGNTLLDWARMNVTGARNVAAFGAEPDVKAWSEGVALNVARVPPEHPGSPALDDALARLQQHAGPGLARLAELSAQGA